MIYCYLLVSLNPDFLNHSYVGITKDLQKRLDKHNGILSGGAKHTRSKRPWKILCYIEGFETYGNALSIESQIKKNIGYEKRKIYMENYTKNNKNTKYITYF